MIRSFVFASLLLVGCAHGGAQMVKSPELELCLDEGRSSERPLIPDKTFEILMKFDPKLPAYKIDRMRFLLAQPGHIVFTIYALSDEGTPGAVLKVIDRVYQPSFTSSADDGKWVTEDLSDMQPQKSAIYVGAYSPEKASDPRLWASSNDTGNVFQRDVDPGVRPGKIPRTPKLRLVISPD